MNNTAVFQEFSQFELTKALYTSEIFAKIDLTASAKLFLWALCSHYNPKNPTMFPSQATVAKKLGISEKSAERAVKELKDKGLVTYVTKHVNHYTFSRKFFEIVKMSVSYRQNVAECSRQNVGLTNKENKKNNKDFSFSSFGKTPYGKPCASQNGGKAVPSLEETQELLEERRKIREIDFNPLDYNREDALKWLKMAPEFWLKRSTIARSLVKKYDFKDFKYLLEIEINSL